MSLLPPPGRRVGMRESAPPIKIPSFSSMRLRKPGRRASTPTTVLAALWRADPSLMPAWTISAKAMCSPSGSSTASCATPCTSSKPCSGSPSAVSASAPHGRADYRGSDGHGHAHHHGGVRPTRTRHHDRAHPGRAGRCLPRTGARVDAAIVRRIGDRSPRPPAHRPAKHSGCPAPAPTRPAPSCRPPCCWLPTTAPRRS